MLRIGFDRSRQGRSQRTAAGDEPRARRFFGVRGEGLHDPKGFGEQARGGIRHIIPTPQVHDVVDADEVWRKRLNDVDFLPLRFESRGEMARQLRRGGIGKEQPRSRFGRGQGGLPLGRRARQEQIGAFDKALGRRFSIVQHVLETLRPQQLRPGGGRHQRGMRRFVNCGLMPPIVGLAGQKVGTPIRVTFGHDEAGVGGQPAPHLVERGFRAHRPV